jgi:NADH dehydrogenase
MKTKAPSMIRVSDSFGKIISMNIPKSNHKRVVIIGCGFGGLELAKSLKSQNFQVVLIDKNNFHTFQPLLYQVSTAGLEADSIAYPIRKIFKGQKNFHFRMAVVNKVLAEQNEIETNIGNISYDFLVIATGSTTNYFGNKQLEATAMPMKTVAEALNLRSLILQNMEAALIAKTEDEKAMLQNIVVAGGGPTGVELAGALCELKTHVLPNDYPDSDLSNMRIILVEAGNALLQSLLPQNQKSAEQYLRKLGAELMLGTRVVDYDGSRVLLSNGMEIPTNNLIWTAGVTGNFIEGLSKASIEKGRIVVDEFNRVGGYDNIFAIGDLALLKEAAYPNGHPMVAPVAVQQASLLANNLIRLMKKQSMKAFRYFDKGSMATVGRNKAVVEVGKLRFGGFVGWFVWMALHLMLLVGFRNRVIVFVNWVWNYINYDRHIRLIIRPFSRI